MKTKNKELRVNSVRAGTKKTRLYFRTENKASGNGEKKAQRNQLKADW